MPAKSNSNVDAATNLAFKSLRVTLLGLIFLACNRSYGQSMRVMSRDELRDRIGGAWAAQMIGVSYGAPTEFKTVGKIIEGEIKGDDLSNAIDQDDLYLEMTFAHVMDTIGLDATTSDYGEAFKNTKYKLWHANAAARRNLNRGVKAPMSGHPTFNLHADDIDFQIEADSSASCALACLKNRTNTASASAG